MNLNRHATYLGGLVKTGADGRIVGQPGIAHTGASFRDVSKIHGRVFIYFSFTKKIYLLGIHYNIKILKNTGKYKEVSITYDLEWKKLGFK